jgi:hypothetical protein
MQIRQLRHRIRAIRDQRALAERVHPILIPQHTQQLIIQARLEHLDLELVVLVRVDTKVLDLAERDRLVLGRGHVLRRVVLGERAEGADVDLARGDGAVRVDHDRDERVLVLLVVDLRVDVDAGQPAAVARMRVVPPDGVLQSSCLFQVSVVIVEVLPRRDAPFRSG